MHKILLSHQEEYIQWIVEAGEQPSTSFYWFF